MIFQNPDEFFQFFYVYKNTVFEKKIEAVTVKLLVQLPEKFLCVIWKFVTKTQRKFVTFTFKNVQKRKKKWKNSYGF